jgi:hypothetical protein
MGRRLMLAPSHPLQLTLGLIVWSVWFVALYGGLSVGCALAPPDAELGARTWLNGLLGVLTAVTFAWLVRQAWACWRAARPTKAGSPRRFLTTLGASLYAVAAVSTLVIGIPLLGLPPCP